MLRASAWAMSIRSKGSRWNSGKALAREASSKVIRQFFKTLVGYCPGWVQGDIRGFRQFAKPMFGGNLPRSRRADHVSFRRVENPRWRTDADKRRLSVSHQISAWVSSNNRNRTHLPTLSTLLPEVDRRNCPEHQLSLENVGLGLSPLFDTTNRATGLPLRAMTTSSPASTCASRRDRLVFAS